MVLVVLVALAVIVGEGSSDGAHGALSSLDMNLVMGRFECIHMLSLPPI